ncbi:MAG: TonB-dependent receptor [Phenylobacterium sp.]|uniref:TonB-dependent receptor n=1 Tax=Phenylobacterium sp. TaxID=1871053 RepID=UPI0025D66E0A|nr:TonB-dependent receptor [Phenylobacterium sp.]MBI1197133.1 TonB-dependent receptor [Phenylobacterium sp.]
MKHGSVAALAAACASLAGQAAAGEAMATAPPKDGVQEVVVFGRGESKIGVAHAASEGTIAGSDMLVRPLLKTAELLEAVPGLIAAQHSGSGKANQYFLRGFNLDHGTDFTTYVDDVQMNLRTHGHGQGYLDLNGLMPEVITREDFRKGPYRADGGDFALAGASYLTTVDAFDRNWAAGEAGSHGYRRGAAGGSVADGAGGQFTAAGEVKVYDGPWQEPEHLRHYAAFVKYERPTALGELELSAHGYHGTWRPTEQIPERIIGSPVCADVFCSPDPTARGKTDRLVVNARLSGEGWKANVYGQTYAWNMYSNPTYANPDGSSAQIHQFDRRWIVGLKAERTWAVSPALDLRVGTEDRFDRIGKVGVAHTDDRAFVESLGFYRVEEASAAVFGEATWRPVEGLRLIGGLRGDWYHATVAARDAEAAALGAGKAHDAVLSPKIDAAYAVNDHIELYADWGRGFHSNDVRGHFAATPVPILVKGTGKELGARFQAGRFTLTTTYWWLNVGSELRFVGDSNAVEPTGASRRHGYELVAFLRPLPWLAIDGNYTASHARYDNGDHIPNAFENSAALGVSAVSDEWEASVRLRHLGPSPLVEDNSVRDKGSTVVNLRAARKFDNFELYGDLLNVFDRRDKDIAYIYESYIPAFDAAPVEGRLSRVVEPRTLRVGMTYRF